MQPAEEHLQSHNVQLAVNYSKYPVKQAHVGAEERVTPPLQVRQLVFDPLQVAH